MDAVLSDESEFGVGGTMGMKALLCGVEGVGAQMCEEDPSVDIDAATVGLEQGVAGAGTGGGEFLLMWSCSSTYCTVAKGMSDANCVVDGLLATRVHFCAWGRSVG